MAKQITRAQAERKKAQAARFMERIGDSDRAGEFSDMTVDEYADLKGISLANPQTNRRRPVMANGTTTPTKDDLQDRIDDAIGFLDDAYTPEASREELAEAAGNALSALRGEDDDDDEDDDLDDDGDDDAQD